MQMNLKTDVIEKQLHNVRRQLQAARVQHIAVSAVVLIFTIGSMRSIFSTTEKDLRPNVAVQAGTVQVNIPGCDECLTDHVEAELEKVQPDEHVQASIEKTTDTIEALIGDMVNLQEQISGLPGPYQNAQAPARKRVTEAHQIIQQAEKAEQDAAKVGTTEAFNKAQQIVVALHSQVAQIVNASALASNSGHDLDGVQSRSE
jgi:hypothetical protein